MQIIFDGKSVPTRLAIIKPTNLRQGDFFSLQGETVEVLAVQRECTRIEDLRYFLMVTARRENGEVLPLRNLSGKVTAYRRIK